MCAFVRHDVLIFGWNIQKAENRGLEMFKLLKPSSGTGPLDEMRHQDLLKMWEL